MANTPSAFNVSNIGTITSGTINDLAYYAATGTTISALATANSGVLITSGSGVPSISTTLPSGITLVAPVLGTPASGNLANCTGYPATGGAALVALATLTASNSASLAFTSLFSASYYQYLFLFKNILPATNNVIFYAQVGTGGGPSYVITNYTWTQAFAVQNSGAYYGVASDSQAVLSGTNTGSSFGILNSGSGANGSMYISGTNGSSNQATAVGQISYIAATSTYMCLSNIGWNQPAATFTAIKFFMSSGNITSGTIDVYGIVAG